MSTATGHKRARVKIGSTRVMKVEKTECVHVGSNTDKPKIVEVTTQSRLEGRPGMQAGLAASK